MVVQSTDNIWTFTFNSELRYTTWRSTRGAPTLAPPLSGNGHGSQFYMPLSLMAVASPVGDWKLEFSARTGYVNSRQRTAGLEGHVATFTDTSLSGTATYTGINGFVPFVSLNVNAPTGKAALYGPSRFARMDGDLVDVPSFGEGWNVGPTVGVNIPLMQNLILTLSVGHIVRGTFNREGAIDPFTLAQPASHMSPGDPTTYNVALAYQQGPFSAQISGSFSHETDTFVDHIPAYRAGNRYNIAGAASYAWDQNWATNVNGFVGFAERNHILDPIAITLIREDFNSNNVVYRINVEHTWTDGVWRAGPVAASSTGCRMPTIR